MSPTTHRRPSSYLRPDGTYPPLAGGEDTPEEAAAKAQQAADDAAAAETKAAEDAAAAEKAKADELGDGGKKALDEERRARKAAEKAAKDAQAALKAREDAELSDAEKLKKRAEDAEAKTSTATDKLRRANLLASLAETGITGAAAKAAAKLLDGVEYDDEDEPTNLDAALKAATEEYGDTIFKGAKPRKAPSIDGGAGNEDREGPNLTADELKAAKAAGMTPEEYANYKSPQPTLPAKT